LATNFRKKLKVSSKRQQSSDNFWGGWKLTTNFQKWNFPFFFGNFFPYKTRINNKIFLTIFGGTFCKNFPPKKSVPLCCYIHHNCHELLSYLCDDRWQVVELSSMNSHASNPQQLDQALIMLLHCISIFELCYNLESLSHHTSSSLIQSWHKLIETITTISGSR
jgi:hypothetical protein